jgi:predicted nucleic acid-binding protein
VTLFLDTSGLVKRYVAEPDSERAIALMDASPGITASACAAAEATLALCRAGVEDSVLERFRSDWARIQIVPVDAECLDRAARIGCDHVVRTLDAIHLAAADRLPRPVRFLTFDARQAAAARSLGFEVVGIELPPLRSGSDAEAGEAAADVGEADPEVGGSDPGISGS